MNPLAAVWNGTERRLRTPIRVVLTAVVVAVVAAGFGLALATTVTPPNAPQVVVAVTSLLTAAAVLAGCAAAAFVLDRRRFRSYGLRPDRNWVVDLVAGGVLGAVSMFGVFAVAVGAGWASVAGTARVTGGFSFPVAFGLVAAAFLFVSVGEELALRGYLLTNLSEGLRPFGDRLAVAVAVVVSSAAFGVLHASNPAATAVSVAGVAVAGVMLAAAYVSTGRLGLPVGLHFSWNLFQGPVFGFPVSGFDVGVSVLVLDVSGPARLTGGAFGPEAGLVGVGATVVGTLLAVGYGRLRYGSLDLTPLLVPELRWWLWASPADDPTVTADTRLANAEDRGDTAPYDR